MKIKNNFVALKLAPVVKFVFPVLVVAAAVLRFVQVKTVVDPATGFYTASSPLTWAVNLLLIGGACFLAAYAYLSADAGALQPLPYRSTGLFVLALCYGCLLLLNAVKCFGGFLNALPGYGMGGFKEMMSTGALPLLFQAVFALLSGVYFLIVALSYKKGSLLAAKHRLLALAPTAWVAARLLHLFVRKISFVRVSDLFFELLACACMILFFLAFAQTASGVYSTGMAWRLVGFGLPSALLTLGVQLPRLVFMFIDAGSFLNENHPFSATDLIFGFLAFGLGLLLLKTPAVPDEQPKEAPAPAQERTAFDDISPINFG